MRAPKVSFTLVTILAVSMGAAAQTPEPPSQPIGFRFAKFKNPGKVGAKTLGAVVHYPATAGAKRPRNAPLVPGTARLPVIVFLHGFGATGGMMVSIGQHFAEAGYVTVLTNTTRTNRGKQAVNAGAFFGALQAANRDKDSFLFGRLDMARVGIAGHSMGGGNTMRVLGDDNPGFKAGFCFAPWTTRGAGESEYVGRFCKGIRVPLAIVHGVRDKVLPWRSNAQRLFDALRKNDSFQAFWVLGDKATHVNVAVPSMLQREADPTFKLCASMATAFFDRYLRGREGGLKKFLDKAQKPAGVQDIQVRGTTTRARKAAPKRRIF